MRAESPAALIYSEDWTQATTDEYDPAKPYGAADLPLSGNGASPWILEKERWLTLREESGGLSPGGTQANGAEQA
ncbi:hypothetical protein BKX93_22495 [Chromobacterium vaccinii]|uniref:Uncharacterized protein n=1 Tax=Chromobacterium vaccinii TaxID=1108595 RepID=A0A1D9LMJ8_9NEIS|nr:hypothetical protein BKX93_22495 [Chromobacterium vaccinii]